MIHIIYAHPSEIIHLKNKIDLSSYKEIILWHRWNKNNTDNIKNVLKNNNKQKFVLNIGCCGSLNSNLSLGELVIVDKISGDNASRIINIESEYQELARKYALQEKIPLVSLYTSKKPVVDNYKKENINRDKKSDIVDMEVLYIYRLTSEYGIPFISFKVISDYADSKTIDKVKEYSHKWSKILGDRVYDFLSMAIDGN